MDYALLIYRTTSPTEPLPEGADRAGLATHRALQAEASAKGELHAVARLDDAPRARTVRFQANAHEITDGPYLETKEWLVGFYVLECDDEAQAIARARALCPDGSHAIEVRPVTWRWRP